MSQHEFPGSRTSSPTRPWILRIASSVGQFAFRIMRTQAFRRFLGSIPILLVIVGVPVAAAKLRDDPSAIRARYEQVAASAEKRKDTKTASVCLDRLTRLKNEQGIHDPDFILRLVTTARDLEQYERAEVLLDEIAPEDRPVHAPAHYLRAMILLRAIQMPSEAGTREAAAEEKTAETKNDGEGRATGKAGDVVASGEKAKPNAPASDEETEPNAPTHQERIRAERHLRYALKLQPGFTAAHQVIGLLALQEGDWSRAEEHLERAAKDNPSLSYQVAVTLYNQDRREAANTWARQARAHFQKLVEENPDNHAARLLWASSALMLEDYDAGRTILQQGLRRENLREFHQLLARADLAEAARLQQKDPTDLAGRLTLLESGLQHDPTNLQLIARLWEVMRAGGPEADQLRARLRAMLAEGRALATAHLILGYEAWEADRTKEAQLHWERALEAAPTSAMVANNLAWALASNPEPDLPRALDLIEMALGSRPDDPNFLSTHGRILARLGRWKEALSSLETALPALPDNQTLHADLADVYTALGSTALAAEHRRLAEEASRETTASDR